MILGFAHWLNLGGVLHVWSYFGYSRFPINYFIIHGRRSNLLFAPLTVHDNPDSDSNSSDDDDHDGHEDDEDDDDECDDEDEDDDDDDEDDEVNIQVFFFYSIKCFGLNH